MVLRETLEDRHEEPRRDRLRAADPQLAGAGIGDVLDVPDALPQLVEGGPAAPQQGFAIGSGNDTLRAAIEQPHAERMLQGGDRFRDRRSRDAELGAGPRHAAVLDHGEEDEQVAQPQSAADLLFPRDRPGH